MKRCFYLLTSLVLSIVADKNLSNYPCFRVKHSNYRNSRIIGGQSVPNRMETPYMAALTRSGNVFCGSSIISEKFLILAAHCVCNNQNKIILPTQLKVYIGMNKISDINKLNDDSQQVIVDKIISHPSYSCGKKSDSDIGKVLSIKNLFFFYSTLLYTQPSSNSKSR
jgi:secreted trypsin-like serine protease